MAYISTAKTINTIRYERICEHCQTPITSMRKNGLSGAYRKHLQAKHEEIYEATKRPKHYAPEHIPVTPVKPSTPCPYCDVVLTSTRESLLPKTLTNHKREKHEAQFIDEIAARNECILNAVQAEPLVEVPVIRPYYTKAHLSARYPAPKTVNVPARWGVTGVFVKCCADGKFLAYRGRMGASEAWEVG